MFFFIANTSPNNKIPTNKNASIMANNPKEFNETAKGYKKTVSISKIKNRIA